MTLTRDAVVGAIVIPLGITIARYFRSTDPGYYSDNPSSVVKTAGQIIPVPTECSINGGEPIIVPFGDIDASQLQTGVPSLNFEKSIELNFSYNTSITQDTRINLVATAASFNSKAIASSMSTVGVIMLHDGKPVSPGYNFNSTLVNGSGSDIISFSPTLNSGAGNVQRSFTVFATLVMASA